MKRWAPAVLLVAALAGYLVGYAQSPGAGPSPLPPLMPDNSRKAAYWDIDALRATHDRRVAARQRGERPTPGVDFTGARLFTHNMQLITRYAHAAEVPSNFTGTLSLWDDAEMHEGVTDFYVIVGGHVTMVVNGNIENREYRRAGGPGSALMPGEFVGQPITGGTRYKADPGDWLAIPPNTPHQPLISAEDASLTYLLFKVNIGTYPGSLSR
jgi:mannose-6-phosphate isomerase-like protein (cupin superfamily)